jgi:3-deoxy-D-arabino-heptulosonate 7-phosphate (DAHP) synthase class II
MNTARERLLKIINEIPESELEKVLDFAEFIKDKEEKKKFKDLTKASESSLDFWNNDVSLYH